MFERHLSKTFLNVPVYFYFQNYLTQVCTLYIQMIQYKVP